MASPQLGGLTITVDDGGSIRQVERALVAWGDAWRDMTPAWESVGEYVLSQNMLNVTGEGSVYGEGWAPLAPSTIAERVSAGWGAGPVMWRTGLLARSLAMRGAEGNVFEAGPHSIKVGSEIEYAGYQHYGTSRGIPARALVGLTWDGEQQVVRILQDWLNEKARLAGLL